MEEEEEEEQPQPQQPVEPVEDEDGWTYLHLVVSAYARLTASDHEETARLLIRAVYRLALAGIDVNVRDTRGRTALVLAAVVTTDEAGNIDQSLVTHLLRVGQSEVTQLIVTNQSEDHIRTLSSEHSLYRQLTLK